MKRALPLVLAIAIAQASAPARAHADEPPPGAGGGAEPATGLTALPRLRSPARAWYKDWLGWALTATGSFMVIVTATDLGLSVPRWSASGQSWQKFVDAQDTPWRIATDAVFLTVGVGVAACAVARFVLVAKKAERERERFSFAPGGLRVAF
jgi:hypothetical protein